MSSGNPQVSVITATYNWSSVLRYAIQSVLWQDFEDFEYLVIGDGCTDDTAEVVASFGDDRIRWHNLPQNSGSQSAPNNVGLEMARGDYVAYLGHDDVWHPCHLRVLVEAMRLEEADLAHTLAEIIGPPDSGLRVLTGIFPSGRYDHGWLPPSSIMHQRSLVHEIGDWKDYRSLYLSPDHDYVMRAWNHRQRFTTVKEVTVFKFPSAWRPSSYRDKPSFEQAEYVRRITEEPDFRYRELLAVTQAYALGKHRQLARERSRQRLRSLFAPRGALVERWREVRGLERRALERPGPIHFVRRMVTGFKMYIHRLRSRIDG